MRWPLLLTAWVSPQVSKGHVATQSTRRINNMAEELLFATVRRKMKQIL